MTHYFRTVLVGAFFIVAFLFPRSADALTAKGQMVYLSQGTFPRILSIEHGTTYTVVRLTSATQVIGSDSVKLSVDKLATDDQLEISGTRDKSGVLVARSVKNLSLRGAQTTFIGNVVNGICSEKRRGDRLPMLVRVNGRQVKIYDNPGQKYIVSGDIVESCVHRDTNITFIVSKYGSAYRAERIIQPTSTILTGTVTKHGIYSTTTSGRYFYVDVQKNATASLRVDLPVWTHYTLKGLKPSEYGNFKVGDRLEIRGSTIDGRFLASSVRNLSRSSQKMGTILGSADIPPLELIKPLSRPVSVQGDYAYLASNGLAVVDLSNPTKPVIAAHNITNKRTSVVTVHGQYAYIGDIEGLKIFDISTPASPLLVGQLEEIRYRSSDPKGQKMFPSDIEVINGRTVALIYAYDTTKRGMLLIDVSNPVSPVLGSRFPFLGTTGNNAVLVGTKLFVQAEGQLFQNDTATVGSRLFTLDVTDPGNPVVLNEDLRFFHDSNDPNEARPPFELSDVTDDSHLWIIGGKAGYRVYPILGNALGGSVAVYPYSCPCAFANGSFFTVPHIINPVKGNIVELDASNIARPSYSGIMRYQTIGSWWNKEKTVLTENASMITSMYTSGDTVIFTDSGFESRPKTRQPKIYIVRF